MRYEITSFPLIVCLLVRMNQALCICQTTPTQSTFLGSFCKTFVMLGRHILLIKQCKKRCVNECVTSLKLFSHMAFISLSTAGTCASKWVNIMKKNDVSFSCFVFFRIVKIIKVEMMFDLPS